MFKRVYPLTSSTLTIKIWCWRRRDNRATQMGLRTLVRNYPILFLVIMGMLKILPGFGRKDLTFTTIMRQRHKIYPNLQSQQPQQELSMSGGG